jgi:uncharacterized protein (TIGR03000 family)
MSLKKSLVAAFVAVSAVAMMTETSNAWGWFRGGSCGSSGGSWGSRGSWGSHGGSWGSHGGSWGSHGGSWGSHGGSYGSHGSYGGGYAARYYGSAGYARREVVSRNVVASSKPAVKTRLTLHVPADAKVTLAGVTTKQTGETRQFSTTNLKAGQVWDDYKVVVEMEQSGQMLREERTIKLTGGKAQELEISFDSSQLAQR